MKYELDTHIHTISSGHAYSTVTENAEYAAKAGLKLIATTDHAPQMPGSCGSFHFLNLDIIPRFINGVEILRGVELNIMDKSGAIDLEEYILKKLEVVIASLHIPCIKPSTKEDNTEAIINAMANPYVRIIGHPGDPRYPIDIQKLVSEAKKTSTLLEINNTSLSPNSTRAGGEKIILDIIKECKKQNQPIILGSDSHYHTQIGSFENAEKLLEEVQFPKELIINYSADDFKAYLGIK